MELLIDKIRERLKKENDFSLESLSKEELMTLWYEEGNSDNEIAELFNVGIHKVSSTRKRKGVVKKTVMKENEKRRMEIWCALNQGYWEREYKISKMKSLLSNKDWLLGVMNVFHTDVVAIVQTEVKRRILRDNDKSFDFRYMIRHRDGLMWVLEISFQERMEDRIHFRYEGKDYSKAARDIIWSFVQVIEKKLQKLEFNNFSYSRLPEAETYRKIDIKKKKTFKEDILSSESLDVFEGFSDEEVEKFVEEQSHDYIHYLGEKEDVIDFRDVLFIEKKGSQHYALTLREEYLENKTKREIFTLYEKVDNVLRNMNLCVFVEFKEHE